MHFLPYHATRGFGEFGIENDRWRLRTSFQRELCDQRGVRRYLRDRWSTSTIMAFSRRPPWSAVAYNAHMGPAATGVFASIQWAWIIKVGLVLFCCRRFLHAFRKNHPSSWLVDLIWTILLGVAWMIFLILSHASQGAIELVAAFLFAFMMDDLFDKGWKRMRRRWTRTESTPPRI